MSYFRSFTTNTTFFNSTHFSVNFAELRWHELNSVEQINPLNTTQPTAYLNVEDADNTLSGNIQTTGEIDWVRMDLTAGQSYQFDLQGAPTAMGTLSDTLIAGIYDSQGNALGYADDDGGESLNSRTVFEPNQSGEYFIAVSAYSGNTGSYELSATKLIRSLEGNAENNRLQGTDSIEDIYGYGGNDSLYGYGSNDRLDGGAGMDTLDGGAGNDLLRGGSGNDLLNGGLGSDTYLFKAGDGNDRIIDSEGTNTLVFQNISSTDNIVVTRDNSTSYSLHYTDQDVVTINALNQNDVFRFSDGVNLTTTELLTAYLAATTEPTPTVDFQDNISTTAYLAVNESLSSAIELERDVDWVKVDLIAGQTYEFDMQGAPTGKGSLADTVIEGIYDSRGNALGYGNDDDGISYNSKTTFEAATSGEYFIAVRSYGNGTGTYELSATQLVGETTPAPSTPPITNPPTAPDNEPPTTPDVAPLPLPYFMNALIPESFNPQRIWDNDITYYFSDGSDNTELNPNGYSQSQKATVVDALQSWAAVADISFNLVNDSNQADIVFYRDSSPSAIGAAAYAYFYGNVHVDNDIDINYRENEHNRVLVHEIGHSLGLNHPRDYGDGLTERFELPINEDTSDQSQMSYTSIAGSATAGPQIYDIAAVHYIYGVNQSTNVGDSSYSLADRYIADAEGVDTLNASNESEQVTINLQEGSWNHVGAISDSILDDNQSFIGYGTVIENAIGGEANDSLTGNHLANQLIGNAGNDILDGSFGKDTLTGGLGSDTFYFDMIEDSAIAYADVITDFEAGIDNLDLSGIDANINQRGDQAFTSFIGTNESFTAAGQLQFNNGTLYGNNDNDAQADFAIELAGMTRIDITDIIV